MNLMTTHVSGQAHFMFLLLQTRFALIGLSTNDISIMKHQSHREHNLRILRFLKLVVFECNLKFPDSCLILFLVRLFFNCQQMVYVLWHHITWTDKVCE